MKTQFTKFTPAAMSALGKDITASFDACAATLKSCGESTEAMRARTSALLGRIHEERQAAADLAADARRVYASELRSAVRALLDRCEMTRESLASEIHAASDAFQKSRPRAAERHPAPARPASARQAPARRSRNGRH